MGGCYESAMLTLLKLLFWMTFSYSQSAHLEFEVQEAQQAIELQEEIIEVVPAQP